jgi:phosphohistidine phosphatase
MDLVLWRHAEAHELDAGQDSDLHRELTARGLKQAQRMSRWLDAHLPAETKILCSPARRCLSTAQALGRKYKVCSELAPDQGAQALLTLANWPLARGSVLIVGHQPTLGQVIGQLIGLADREVSVRKGSMWWLRHRIREDQASTVVYCVQTPDMLW